MKCVIAFLLLSAKDPENIDRMIVTHFETNAPSYGVYELTNGRNFPHPTIINQPGVIWNPAIENGTNIMSYCSNSLQSHEIVDKITSGMTDITSRAHLHWNENHGAEMDCCRSLIFVNNLEEKIDDNIMSKFSPKMKSKCTNQVILNLAFSGIIAVDGEYRKYAPPKADQPVVVTLDQPMELRSLLLNGELIKGKETVFGQEALAWYQGHLHLFKRNIRRDAWLPVTTIGYESDNGWLIYNFINVNFPEIFNSWKDYYKNCAEYKIILRKLSRHERRKRHRNNLYWGDKSFGRKYASRHPFNDLLDICHPNSNRDFFSLYSHQSYSNEFYYIYYRKYHSHKNVYEKLAKEFKDKIYDDLKKLLPCKLVTSIASGITMAT
ncbi:putative effector protein [Blumeria hordei DH14]|uniref:Putative effector protein n=1 Tax=Blumeria graminis f. sp. hordei (strain DH14) TaxID=546991 RepID=N1J8Z8_BLUG1|nr:putative effector protein [Blumeria hordei DH14]